MTPIDVYVEYYNKTGRLIESVGRVKVAPGETQTLTGKLSQIEISCDPKDNGGEVKVIGTADDVKKGGLTGLGGRFGTRIKTVITHSSTVPLNISGEKGKDVYDIRHKPLQSKIYPL